MNISSINTFKLNNSFKTLNNQVKCSNFINSNAQFDKVSFKGKCIYFDGYNGERHSDDYAIWLMTPEDEDDENSMTPIEKAFDEGEIQYFKTAIDSLSMDKYWGCDEELRDEVVFYCLDLINDESVNYDNDYIAKVLSIVLDRADDTMLLEIKDEERKNNILSNLVSSNNTPAIENLFEKCSNKTLALLMVQKNADEQYSIGEWDNFAKSRKILGRARLMFDDVPLFSGRKIEPKTTYLLRRKAIEIIEDEKLSPKLRNKIKEIYMPNKDERKNFINEKFAKELEQTFI